MGKLIKPDTALPLDKTNTGEYLKPLSRDILLFTTKIASTHKLKEKEPLFQMAVGDRLSFKIGVSEYEDDQIIILSAKREVVGYVPEGDSKIFARLMEAGKFLFVIVKSLSFTNAVPLIEIDICLRDF